MLLEAYALRKGTVQRTVRFGASSSVSTIEDRSDAGLDAHGAWWQSFLRGAIPQVSSTEGQKVIVDAFCGSGGLSLGVAEALRATGHIPSHQLAIDTDGSALEVHRLNFGTKAILRRSVSSLVDYSTVEQNGRHSFAYPPEVVSSELAGIPRPDFFLAGPPCEGHSNLNNYTRREDPRNDLFAAAVALGVAMGARTQIIENVPMVLNAKSRIVEKSIDLLRAMGYGVATGIVKGEKIGAAQRRHRFFLLAVKDYPDLDANFLNEQMKSFEVGSRPLSWALGDLQDRISDTLIDSPAKLSPENIGRIHYLFENELYDLPDKKRPVCHQDGTTYTSVYGRLRWDQPAQTITSGFNTPGQGRYIHPTRKRVITPREAARLQFFPDSFGWFPPDLKVHRSNLAKWIGDAVPPALGYAVGLVALAAGDNARHCPYQSLGAA